MEDWPRIVSEHGEAVWRAAFRLLGNEADAADCVQETFVAAVKVSRRQPVRNWPALLRRLVSTQALSMLRRRLRHRKHLDAAAAETCDAQDCGPGPTDRAEANEAADMLRRALARLPEQQAAVLSLRFFEDLSYDEIAEALGLKSSAVGVLIHRARIKLRELMAAESAAAVPEVQHG